ALSKFQTKQIPATLMGSGVALDKIDVRIRRLCHHMFLDTYGRIAPQPNPLFQLHFGLLTNSPQLEYVVGALGSHKEAKVAESMRLGKAFCRWFLDQHFQFTYFGHMDDLLDKTPLPQYNNIKVIRIAKKDTPDYLCADSTNRIFLAEAKGRQDASISFANS